jgi:hypothetical protein
MKMAGFKKIFPRTYRTTLKIVRALARAKSLPTKFSAISSGFRIRKQPDIDIGSKVLEYH